MSSHLTSASFEKARTFILSQARPLEQCRFQFHFEDGSAEAVLAELASFQNEDGGFGHGLEADIHAPASSAIATSVAFQVLRELAIPAGNEIVQCGVAYLLATYDSKLGIWPQIPPAVNESPRAPWWNWKPLSTDNAPRFRVNPRAELAGYLWDYASLAPSNFLETLTESVVEDLEAASQPIEMHDLLCYLRFTETKMLPKDMRERALAKLREAISAQVGGPDTWNGYGLRPLDVAPTPQSEFHAVLAPRPEEQLEIELNRQGEDGAWGPSWSWGEQYPGAWAQAEREWKGVLTLNMLLVARNYGHIE